jgi:hypothetical protein
MIYKCIYYVKNYKHKDFGRVGAINLEQLDSLLVSLKSYWGYSNQKASLYEINATSAQFEGSQQSLAYEL